jgi:hypothetical protein
MFEGGKIMNVFWNVIIGVLVVMLLVSGLALLVTDFKGTSENKLFKTILYADAQVVEVSVDSQTALSYYSEAGLSYEKADYSSVESNCRLARGYFMTVSSMYKDIEAELEAKDMKDSLIDIYIEELKYLSEIQTNLYEACEHFESAARYYNIYYNTNVPNNDQSYTMGTGEIEAMNEKIALHDENVRKYNNLLADYKIELKKRIE